MVRNRLKTGRQGKAAVLLIGLFFGFLALDGSAQASPILYGSVFEQGFSVLTGALKIDGTVNYAVFTGADFNTLISGLSLTMGTSSPAKPTNPGFVYVFQVTNNGTNTQAISNFSAGFAVLTTDITSWGYIPGNVFIDGGSPTPVSATNDLLSIDTLDGFGPPSGSSSDPSSVALTSTSVWVTWSGIAAGGSSSLIFYTSNYGPSTLSSQINGGGFGASGPTPGASVPEPSTILLMTLGLVGLAGFGRGFRKKEGER